MENSIVVPFDLNTARKIKSGEIVGEDIPYQKNPLIK